MQKTKARGMKGVLDCEMIRRILVGDFTFEIRHCPSDSHPSGGFPVSKFEITSLCSMLAPSAKRLAPCALLHFLGLSGMVSVQIWPAGCGQANPVIEAKKIRGFRDPGIEDIDTEHLP
jgi:hypothetical protein